MARQTISHKQSEKGSEKQSHKGKWADLINRKDPMWKQGTGERSLRTGTY